MANDSVASEYAITKILASSTGASHSHLEYYLPCCEEFEFSGSIGSRNVALSSEERNGSAQCFCVGGAASK